MGQIEIDLSEQAIITTIKATLFELSKLRSLWPKAEIAYTSEMLVYFTTVSYPHSVPKTHRLLTTDLLI
jgi:hypothetical protein